MHRYTITGPEVAHRVGSPDALLAKLKAHLDTVGLDPRPWTGEAPYVFVSEGRAVINCECGNGPQVSREWCLAVCFACGYVYRAFKFPVGWSDIDMLMSVRPRRYQNVEIGDSIEALSEENRARLLPHVPDDIRAARQIAVAHNALSKNAGDLAVPTMVVGGKALRR